VLNLSSYWEFKHISCPALSDSHESEELTLRKVELYEYVLMMERGLCKFNLKRKNMVKKLEGLCCVCSESVMDNLSCVGCQVIFSRFWEK
jgi:hypothetical protein